MKKSDLKTGMIVEIRKGEKALVMKDNIYGEDAIVFSFSNWTGLDSFDDNLIWHNEPCRSLYCKKIDIVRIYKPVLPTGFFPKENNYDDNELTLLWERTPEKIYKIDDIEYSESTLRSLIKKATI